MVKNLDDIQKYIILKYLETPIGLLPMYILKRLQGINTIKLYEDLVKDLADKRLNGGINEI